MKKGNFILIAFLLGILVAVIDTIFDYYFFYEGTFVELLITNVPSHEIYIRLTIVFIFTIFGFFVSRTYGKLDKLNLHLFVLILH